MKNYKLLISIFVLIITLFVGNIGVRAADIAATCAYKAENGLNIIINILDDYKLDINSDVIKRITNKNNPDGDDNIQIFYSDFVNNESKKIDCEQVKKIFLSYDADLSGGIGTYKFTLKKEPSTNSNNEVIYNIDVENSKIYNSTNIDKANAEKEDWIKVCHYGPYTLSFNEDKYESDIYFEGYYNNFDSKELMKYLQNNEYSCPAFLCEHHSPPDHGNSYKYYTFSNKSEEGCMSAMEYTGGYVCGGLNRWMDAYEKAGNIENSVKRITEQKKASEKVQSLCSSIVQSLDYDDHNNCVKECLQVVDILRNGDTGAKNNECGFSDRLGAWIINIMKWIKYILPVIVIVLGIIDFIKAIGADKDDEMKKAQGKFVKRLIAAALVFIIPFILQFVLEKLGFAANGCGIIDL